MTMTKEQNIFSIIENRKSLRRFLKKQIPDDVLKKILKAGIRAPFAAQLCSIVYTRKKSLMLSLGAYPTSSVYMIFFIDVRRLEKIMTQRGHKYDFDDSMTLWLGIQDVTLAVENVILAAEALGMGSVLIGSVPNHANLISMKFKIPKRVFPVVGLCLGYPDPREETDIRPRFPLQYSAFEDAYQDHTASEIQECMKAMDEGYLAQGYYIKLRAKIPLKTKKDEVDYDKYSWSEHISRKFCQGRHAKDELIDTIRKQGFTIS